jgi:hypothetical protein
VACFKSSSSVQLFLTSNVVLIWWFSYVLLFFSLSYFVLFHFHVSLLFGFFSRFPVSRMPNSFFVSSATACTLLARATFRTFVWVIGSRPRQKWPWWYWFSTGILQVRKWMPSSEK